MGKVVSVAEASEIAGTDRYMNSLKQTTTSSVRVRNC